MTPTNRRNLLLAGAAVVAGTSLGGMSGCPSNTTPQQVLQGVIDAIQAAVATACGFVPSVATLLAILSAFPGIGGVATIADSLLTEVSTFLCTQFHAQGGATAAVAQKTLTGKLKDGSSVPLHGLVVDPATGKFVRF
jgi:hypothetical protein